MNAVALAGEPPLFIHSFIHLLNMLRQVAANRANIQYNTMKTKPKGAFTLRAVRRSKAAPVCAPSGFCCSNRCRFDFAV